MATEFSADGQDMVHDGALIYIRRVATEEERYRVQIYRDHLPGHQFWNSFEDGTLAEAQQFASKTADWMAIVPPEKPIELICPQCARKDRFTEDELVNARGFVYCGYHEVKMITLVDFDEMVNRMEVHPDDFETVEEEEYMPEMM